MGKDKSILEKITDTVKDIANIAANAADHALKADPETGSAIGRLYPAGRRRSGFRSHDGPAGSRRPGPEEKARRAEAGGKEGEQNCKKEEGC